MNPNIRSQLIRGSLTKVDDSGPQQLIAVTGITGQAIGDLVRSQHFGLTSNPPAGSEGLVLALGGGLDRAHGLGFEHPAKRPTGLPSGAATFYDANGNRWDLTATGAKLTDAHGNIVETKSDRIYAKPAPGNIVYVGGDGVTGAYDWLETASGPCINYAKGRYA